MIALPVGENRVSFRDRDRSFIRLDKTPECDGGRTDRRTDPIMAYTALE